MTDVDVTPTDDPHYLLKHTHVITSDGIYCPDVEGFYDPPAGLHNGDDCPVCGDTVNV